MRVQLFAKMDPIVEACGTFHTYHGVAHPLSDPPRSLSAHVQRGKFSLTSGEDTLSLHFSRVQLLPLALSLVSGREQSFSFTPLDKYQLPGPGAHLSPTSAWPWTSPLFCFSSFLVPVIGKHLPSEAVRRCNWQYILQVFYEPETSCTCETLGTVHWAEPSERSLLMEGAQRLFTWTEIRSFSCLYHLSSNFFFLLLLLLF